jgi:PAS domain S-box-containing protein
MHAKIVPLKEILEPITDKYFYWLTAAILLLLPFSLVRYFQTGWLTLYSFHCSVALLFVLSCVIPILSRHKLVIVVVGCMTIGASANLQHGISQSGEVSFVLAIVLCSVGFGVKGLILSSVATALFLFLPHLAFLIEPLIPTGIRPYNEGREGFLALGWILFCGISASYVVLRLVTGVRSKSHQLSLSLIKSANIARDLTILIDTANAPIFGVDSEGKINEWNQQAEKITGYKKTELEGLSFATAFPGDALFRTNDYRASIADVLNNTMMGEEISNFELDLITKSGESISILLNSTARKDVSGKIIGVVGVGQDITELNKMQIEQEKERKEASAQIIQASKLATLGEMATSVAHELNQPLNVIRVAAENGRRKIATDTADPEYLEKKLNRIIAQTGRAAAIIQHLRMFGREAKEEPEVIDPRLAVENALDLMGTQLRLSGIEIVTELPKSCPSILGHVIQLEQVILNLLANARDAMSDKDVPAKILLRVSADDENVRITTEDTGGGIPKDILERIFEPFYTTKKIGEGTGLGLSVSYGIVRDMGGRIFAENFNDGARITIILPSSS